MSEIIHADKKVSIMVPDQVSADQEQWGSTAEGVLSQMLWQMRTGQVKVKEVIVIGVDYTGGESRTVCVEHTAQSLDRLLGLVEISKLMLIEGAKRCRIT